MPATYRIAKLERMCDELAEALRLLVSSLGLYERMGAINEAKALLKLYDKEVGDAEVC